MFLYSYSIFYISISIIQECAPIKKYVVVVQKDVVVVLKKCECVSEKGVVVFLREG